MAKYTNVQSDFSGGLISDFILGRLDIDRVKNSARVFKNFFPSLQGPAEYRKGFKFLASDLDAQVVEAPYDSSIGLDSNRGTYAIESVDLTLSSTEVYRCVFTASKVKIYHSDGTLKATVTTPYSSGELSDLRFSSETDALYIAHPLHKPKKLETTSSFEARFLKSSDSKFLYSDEDGSGAGNDTNNTGDLQIRGNVEVVGDTAWTLSTITFDVEPLLEPDNTGNTFTIANNKSYVKLDSGSANYFSAIKTDFDGGSAGSFSKSWYVQYKIGDNTFLGLVKKASEESDASYGVADPTNNIVYVDPVDTILDVEDETAMFYLLDAEETSDAEELATLANEGVPDNEIHLRSDTLVFNKGYEGAYIKIDGDRRSNRVAVGQNRSVTRWVRLKEHLGTEDHPVDFIRGTNALRASNLVAGSVYKLLFAASASYFSIGVDGAGAYKVTTGVLVFPGGNKTFTFNNAVDSSAATTGAAWDGTDDVTIGADGVVANLSTALQFDVMKCYNVATDSEPEIKEGSNLIIPADNSVLTVTEVANDVTLTCGASVFDATRDVGRFFKGELPSGNVYMKCISVTSGQQLICQVLNSIPRNSRTLAFENEGRFTSFSFGAWYLDNYPHAVTKYEQRRVYAATYDNPNYMFFSRADNELSFQPTQDDKTVLDTDGITYELSNRTASIKWLTSIKDLVVGTTGGIYRVVPNQYLYGVSPKTIRIELSEEEACSAQAVSVGNSIFYPDQSGTKLLEYKYEINIQSSSSNDVSKLIYPTFINNKISKIVYQHTPQPRIWVLTETAELYCLAHHRQEEFYAWTKIEFDDYAGGTRVLDISVLSKGVTTNTDSVYVTLARPNKNYNGSNGTSVISHIYLNESESEYQLDSTSDKYAAHLDNYIVNTKPDGGTTSYDISAAFPGTQIVSVIADGVYRGEYTTSSGVIPAQLTTDHGGVPNVLIAGIIYKSEIKMMLNTFNGQNKPAYGSDTARVVSIRPFLIDSVSYDVGVSGSEKNRTVSTAYGVGKAFTGFDKELPLAGSVYGVDKVPTFKHSKPYPLVIASITTKTDLN